MIGESMPRRISAHHQPGAVPSPPSATTSIRCAPMIDKALATPISARSLPRCVSGASSAMYSGLTVMQMPTPMPTVMRHASSDATNKVVDAQQSGATKPPNKHALIINTSPMRVATRRPSLRASSAPNGQPTSRPP
eukprot:scaffold14958_cov79-Phaeocystis_antarctica.AAC.4